MVGIGETIDIMDVLGIEVLWEIMDDAMLYKNKPPDAIDVMEIEKH